MPNVERLSNFLELLSTYLAGAMCVPSLLGFILTETLWHVRGQCSTSNVITLGRTSYSYLFFWEKYVLNETEESSQTESLEKAWHFSPGNYVGCVFADLTLCAVWVS